MDTNIVIIDVSYAYGNARDIALNITKSQIYIIYMSNIYFTFRNIDKTTIE